MIRLSLARTGYLGHNSSRQLPLAVPCSRHLLGYFSTGSDGTNRNNNKRNTPRIPNKNRNQPPKDTRDNQKNLDKRILQPAARGELKDRYQSGIPSLLARKRKVRLDPADKKANRRSLLPQDADDLLDASASEGQSPSAAGNSLLAALQRERDALTRQQQQQQYMRRPSLPAAGASALVQQQQQQQPEEEKLDAYFAPELMSQQDDRYYYWLEEDYDRSPLGDVQLDPDEDGNIPIYYDHDAGLPFASDSDIHQDGKYDSIALGLGPATHSANEGLDEGSDDDDVDDEDNDDDNMEDEEETEKGVDADADPDSKRKTANVDMMLRDATGKGLPNDPDQLYFYDQHHILEVVSAVDDKNTKNRRGRQRSLRQDEDHEDDDDTYEPLPEKVMPLMTHGPELDDFLEAVAEHPTAYAQVDRVLWHPHSTREPKPYFPRSRAMPPLEFVKSYRRFLYVSGLPILEIDGEVGDMKNPIHRNMLQQSIGRLVGVDSTRVFPANSTSGFVGFQSPRELANALEAGPTEAVLTSVPYLQTPAGDLLEHDFVSETPSRVLLLSNIPTGSTASSLLHKIFPVDTEVGAVYEGLTMDDFYFLSSRSVLIRFPSEEQASSAASSNLINDQLKSLGEYPIQYRRARRELVHAGFDELRRTEEVRVVGPRLIVDGDMPSRSFYISHAGAIRLRNVDPNVTKETIAGIVQPHCTQVRDTEGSVEFVTCHAGRRTGEAYIGFDMLGEAEAFMNSCKGALLQLGDHAAILQLVRERKIPGQAPVKLETRQERDEEALLDDLNNWEKHVDPKDIELLVKAGVSKVVLDEAIRGIRFNNATFGPLDSALRSEAIEPQKESGQLYKEMVQLYISTLIECLPTRENVGPIYEMLHGPGEPIDLSIFDREEERQKELLEKRKNV